MVVLLEIIQVGAFASAARRKAQATEIPAFAGMTRCLLSLPGRT
jgi:hypothetical protein